MPFSHHSHSGQFCKHASGSLEEVVLEAIRQNFIVYGLTEHVPRYREKDLYPEEKDINLKELENQFDNFIEEAHRLKDRYSESITILVGAETENITPEDLHGLSRLLKKHSGRIEYLVGSVHHVNEVPIDFDHPTYNRALDSFNEGRSDDADMKHAAFGMLMERYFDAQYQLMEQFKPEIIGHIDLCRLYYPNMIFKDFPNAQRKLERNIRFAAKYGALFEFNASAFRKGWDSAYPGKDLVSLILSEGGRFTLSDDSHGPHAVGLNYNRLYLYLKDIGIDELWYLQQCKEGDSTGRRMRPVKLGGCWWLNDFWKDKIPEFRHDACI